MTNKRINEEGGGDFGGDMGIDYGSAGGMGGGFGYDPFPKGDLLKIFVEPFLDLAKISYASMKDVGSKTRMLIEKTLSAAASMMVPFIAADYKALDEAEAARSQKISAQYKGAFDRVDRFIATNHDLHGVAFMLAPGMYLSKKYVLPLAKGMTKEMAGAILGTVAMLVPGRASKKHARMTGEMINGNSSAAKKLIEDDADSSFYSELLAAAGGGALGLMGTKESDLHEEEKGKKPNIAAMLGVMLDDKAIRDELENGQIAKKMQEDGKKIASKTLVDVLALNKKYASIRSIDDVNRLLGKKVIDDETLSTMSEQERETAAKVIATQAQKGARTAGRNMIKLKLLKLEKCDVPDDHPLVVAYKNILNKI